MKITKDIARVFNILVVVLTPVLLLPLPFVVGTQESKCAYIVFIMAIYWITEALPIAVTSLLPIILTPLVGLGSAKEVSSHYLSDTSMLFLGGLIIAVAIEHWNIHKRLALAILMYVGTETRWLMLGLMLPTWLLSMWISNTATTAMMIPITNAILLQLKEANVPIEEIVTEVYDNDALKLEDIEVNGVIKENGQPTSTDIKKTDKTSNYKAEPEDNMNQTENKAHLEICKMMSICIAHAANCGGLGSLTGTGPNVVFKGQSDIIFEKYGGESPVTFSSWFAFGLPISAIMLLLSWIWLQLYFLGKGCLQFCSGNAESKSRIKSLLRKEYASLGPIDFAEAAVIGHFVLLALLWITIDIGDGGGWHNIFPPKTVSNSTPAILLSCSLFIFPSRLRTFSEKGPIPPLLTWKIVEKKLPWGVVILLGGGFALAFVSQEYGLSKWLGTQLAVLKPLDPWIVNMILCIIVAAATEVTSNVAMCTLLMPILAELSLQLEVNPLYFMFPAAIATSFAFMLPVATPPNAVVFAYGYLKVIDMVKVGFLMNILGIVVLVIGTETWGESVFGFHNQPDIFKHGLNNTDIINNTCICNGSLLL
ncbi:Na(+)/citrate cotransporter-like isoform X1 [Mytilus galloprovincialis]|uniref:Na(+)/citrate cotransporter-like isoform X1 n=1 Tax=Mytilus galloprovincialis TaxID=29158 RepID=UPI003F7C4D47